MSGTLANHDNRQEELQWIEQMFESWLPFHDRSQKLSGKQRKSLKRAIAETLLLGHWSMHYSMSTKPDDRANCSLTPNNGA